MAATAMTAAEATKTKCKQQLAQQLAQQLVPVFIVRSRGAHVMGRIGMDC